MLNLLITFGKTLGCLVLMVLVYQLYNCAKTYMKISFYKGQGMSVHPNAYIPFIGNIIDFSAYEKAQ